MDEELKGPRKMAVGAQWPGDLSTGSISGPGHFANSHSRGLSPRSLGFDKLLKKFYDTSCCGELGALLRIGNICEHARLPGPRVALVQLVLHLAS